MHVGLLAAAITLCGAIALSLSSSPAASASVAGTLGKVSNQRGAIAATGITGSVSGTTGLTTTKDTGIISLENTSDGAVVVFSSDSAFTKIVPAYSFRVFDLKTNGDIAYAPTTYKAYYLAAPTTGTVEIIAVPVR